MNKEWICINDDLPRAGEAVLFCNFDFTWSGWLEAYEEGEDLLWFACDDREFVDEVTHWMPFPVPFYED